MQAYEMSVLFIAISAVEKKNGLIFTMKIIPIEATPTF
jgi:hypothetical protein